VHSNRRKKQLFEDHDVLFTEVLIQRTHDFHQVIVKRWCCS